MASEYKLRLSQIPPVVIPEIVIARKGNKAAWPTLAGISIAQVEIPVNEWRAPTIIRIPPNFLCSLREQPALVLSHPRTNSSWKT